MLIKFYALCLVLLLCEAATKIGLGNGRPSEEPSSLKTEVLKFKTSECGGSSSEEQSHNNKNKKSKNRNKKDSDEDDDEDSEEDNKKKNKNNAGNNNNNNHSGGRQKNNRGYNREANHEELFTGFSTTSFEHNRNFGMNRGPQDDYMNRRQGPGGDPYQTRWDEDQTRNPSNPRNGNRNPQFNPYGPNFGEDDFNPQNPNRRNQNRGQDPYQPRPGPYNNNRGSWNQDRNQDDRYNNNNNNRDDRYTNRRRPQQNNWDDSSNEDDDSRNNNNSNRRNGQKNNRRPTSRNGGMKENNKKNKNDNSDGECTSQCVFNNMEIMEDDGIPSEAGMIKWAQDKIKNEKLKQSAVKEIRKCFGTLASSDGDNSCNFSKSLSKCLKLGLDEEKD